MLSSGHDILLSPSCIVHSVWTASTANHSSCEEEVVSAGLASSVSPGKTTPVCRPDQSVLLLIALHCSSGALCSKSFHFGIGHSPSPLEISAGNGLVLTLRTSSRMAPEGIQSSVRLAVVFGGHHYNPRSDLSHSRN